MEGHLKAMSGTLLAVYLGSLRILLPRSACNDSSFDSKVAFRHQHSEPYMRTGITHDSIRLLDERGFSWP